LKSAASSVASLLGNPPHLGWVTRLATHRRPAKKPHELREKRRRRAGTPIAQCPPERTHAPTDRRCVDRRVTATAPTSLYAGGGLEVGQCAKGGDLTNALWGKADAGRHWRGRRPIRDRRVHDGHVGRGVYGTQRSSLRGASLHGGSWGPRARNLWALGYYELPPDFDDDCDVDLLDLAAFQVCFGPRRCIEITPASTGIRAEMSISLTLKRSAVSSPARRPRTRPCHIAPSPTGRYVLMGASAAAFCGPHPIRWP